MMQTVAVLGLGYVGFPLAELLVKSKRYRVIGLDIDAGKITHASAVLKSPLFTGAANFSRLKQADIAVVCVPTPVKKDFTPDYEPVKKACLSIAENLKKGQLVIIESTVNPGTCEEIIAPVLEKFGAKPCRDFLLAHCPERIDPGNKKWSLKNIPRNVGGLDKHAAKKAWRFYKSFIKADVKILNSIKAAEATKIVENTFRDINIAYVNELAMSFDKLDIDILEVIEGAKTKPFAFMAHYPGCGVGGHCIPVDPYYLIERAASSGFEHQFLRMARKVNNGMPAYTVKLLEDVLKNSNMRLAGTKIGLLGLAYKKDIDDLRESPALKILEILKRKKISVETFDPFLPDISSVKTLREILNRCKILIFATDHSVFKKIPAKTFKKAGVKLIIDGRNFLRREYIIAQGIIYKGIGH